MVSEYNVIVVIYVLDERMFENSYSNGAKINWVIFIFLLMSYLQETTFGILDAHVRPAAICLPTFLQVY